MIVKNVMSATPHGWSTSDTQTADTTINGVISVWKILLRLDKQMQTPLINHAIALCYVLFVRLAEQASVIAIQI